MNRNFLHIVLLITLACGSGTFSWGQELQEFQKMYEEADFSFQRGEGLSLVPEIQELIQEAKGDTFLVIRTNAQLLLARIFRLENNSTSALRYFIEASEGFRKDTLREQYAKVQAELGAYYQELGATEEAIKSLRESYRFARMTAHENQIAEFGHALAQLYLENKELDSAMVFWKESLKISENQENFSRALEILSELAQTSLDLGENRKALTYNLRMLTLSQQIGDTQQEAHAYNNTGYTLYQIGEPHAALDNFEKALEIDRNQGNLPELIARDLSNIGIAYHALERESEAINTLLSSSELYKKTKDDAGLARNYHLIASIYLLQKDYHNAGVYLDKAFELVRNREDLAEIAQEVYETASSMAQERNDFQLALDYYREHLRLKDSLLIVNKIEEENRIKEAANIKDTEERLRQIIGDQQKNELTLIRLELEKESKDQMISLMEQESQLQAALQREESLENARKLQALEAERERLISLGQANEIVALQQNQKLQEMALEEKSREEILRKQEIKNLERDKALQESQLAVIESRRKYLYAIGGILVLVLLFMLIAYFLNRRANRRLAEKNKAIEKNRRELSQALDQLKSTQGQLVQKEKMASLGQLTAGIAHEINNPVNFISGGISALKRNLDDIKEVLEKFGEITPENAKEVLEEVKELKAELEYEEILTEIDDLSNSISQGATQTSSIVKGLRTFSRLDEGDLKFTDLHENIDSTLVMLRNQYRDRIEIKRLYGKIPQVQCYPGKLNQVFMNLLANAIHAIPEKGWIAIETRQVAEQVEVKIIDSGKGMPEEVRQKIFDPFFTTKDVGEGTGLGLAITLGIIQDHKAEVDVESEVGKGTTFTLKLPIKQ